MTARRAESSSCAHPDSKRTGLKPDASRKRFDAVHLDGVGVHIQLAGHLHLLAHVLLCLCRIAEFVADFRDRILQDKLAVLLHDPATEGFSLMRRYVA